MSALSLTVLGCDGSYPSPGGALSGYLVRTESTTLWVDAGSGTLANLQLHVPLDGIDAVLISHEHPDHWSDLEPYWVAALYGPKKFAVDVYAPKSVKQKTVLAGKEPLRWHDVSDGDAVTIGDIAVRFSRTDHPPETLAMRFDAGGRSLAYSADTADEWSFSSLGGGIHLALSEATVLADKEQESRHIHVSARQAGALARQAGVERLMLTHISPTVDREQSRREASEAFGGAVEIAVIGERYEV